MAVTVFKTFSAGEVLTAADLNSSFTQITSNGQSVGFPRTADADFDGKALIIDTAGDIDIKETATGIVGFRVNSSGVVILEADGSTASVVNGLRISASATGQDVLIQAIGSDPNIDIDVQPKGSGLFRYNGVEVKTVT